jgi:uncharacterized membrane protein
MEVSQTLAHLPAIRPKVFAAAAGVRRAMRDVLPSPPDAPPPPPDPLTPRATLIISGVLRGGVLLSAAIIILGVVLFFARTRAGHSAAMTTSIPRTAGNVLQGVLHGDPVSVIALGLLVLLATPVVRVGVSLVTFVLEGDRLYAAITALVLLILLLSFLSGRAGG